MPNIPEQSSPAADCACTAATDGNPDAQFALAISLAARSAPEPYAQALIWYQKAADQNHRLAQFNLAQMYAHGHGMPKSDSMALIWMRRSAEGGDAGAQFNMGDRYDRASMRGSEMDAAECRVESYKWFALAAAQNYRHAQLRSDSATLRMTREEVLEGNRRVKAFAIA